MKSFLTAALIAYLANQSSGQVVGVPKCSMAEAEKYALCAAQPFIMNQNSSFPMDVASSNIYCQKARSSIACMKDFTAKCLTDLPRQVASLFTYAINKQIKKVCKSPQSRRDIGEKTKCNNQGMAKMDSIMADFVDLNRRVPFMATKDKIAGLCCAYYTSFGNIVTESRKHCSESDANYFSEFTSNFSVDIVELLCANKASRAVACRDIDFPEQTIGDTASVSFMPALLITLETL
ncbi:hypothetical protein HDE_14540 [Halotydeus destructor]|nr:hypothetical protein HDE_14540 [Halotydeus destructor]